MRFKSCGYCHSLILTSRGDVFSFGCILYGQLRKSTDNTIFQKIEELSKIIRIECGFYHNICIDSNNDMFVFRNSIMKYMLLEEMIIYN